MVHEQIGELTCRYLDQGLSKVWLFVAKYTVHHKLDLVFRTPKLIIEDKKRTARISDGAAQRRCFGMTARSPPRSGRTLPDESVTAVSIRFNSGPRKGR